ncbi:MAG: DUF3899 domain-containing protein [Clostridia bacterium]|nr:DUF3899 domain-containing protein [Clostridia bacterium]
MNSNTYSDRKKTRIGYIISISICAAAAVAILFWKKIFSLDETKEIFGVLSDAFFVPGALMVCVGGLSRLGAAGAYDSFGYLFSRFALHNIWVTGKRREKYDSLYEYKQAKDEKGRHWLPYVLWTGVGATAISVVLTVFYLVL